MTTTLARPDDLICPAQEIFDEPATRAELGNAVDEAAGDMAALRRAAVTILSDRMKAGRTAIAEAFAARPFDARPATRAYCWLTDCIILSALDLATQHMHPLPNPTEAERISVFAVGGYGRGEMAPHSDLDLLFLTPYKITAWAESVIESMLYLLWDLRLKVGHASRTALLENRWLTGDRALARRLNSTLWQDLFHGTEREFTEAKLEERDARH